MNRLEAKNINFGYGDRTLLNEASLKVEGGERVALIGPNGCGKTTLLRILCGLLKADDGSITLNEKIVEANTESIGFIQKSNIWPQITLVFQDLQLFPTMTAIENCCFGLEDGEAKTKVNDYARILGVAYCLNRRPINLSRGEQQRISIIRALVRKPLFLLLDEPTAALDQNSRKQLKELLVRESECNNMGILFVTHDLVFAKDVCNRAIIIDNQRLRTANISPI